LTSIVPVRRLFDRVLRRQTPPFVSLEKRQLVIGLGAMKSGTTWLSDYLGSHPQFFHSPIKEMNAFASLFPENPALPGFSYKHGEAYRLWRMEKIVLSLGRNPPRLDRAVAQDARFDRLRALAQLGRIESTDEYLAFFEERIGEHACFGEISPSYAHLPPEAYACMAGLTEDVRFLFLMRDPTDRAASHLRHARRRVKKDIDLAQLLERVDSASSVFIRSDYRYTLNTLRALGLAERCRFLIYEDLFSQDCVDSLCDWLGIQRHEAVLDKRLNPGVGEALADQQLSILREKLAPIYNDLRHDPATQGASSWRW
jgi:hypothetical protein